MRLTASFRRISCYQFLNSSMYFRGEKAFCSCDCRNKEILIEEEMEKPATDSSDSPCSSFHQGLWSTTGLSAILMNPAGQTLKEYRAQGIQGAADCLMCNMHKSCSICIYSQDLSASPYCGMRYPTDMSQKCMHTQSHTSAGFSGDDCNTHLELN